MNDVWIGNKLAIKGDECIFSYHTECLVHLDVNSSWILLMEKLGRRSCRTDTSEGKVSGFEASFPRTARTKDRGVSRGRDTGGRCGSHTQCSTRTVCAFGKTMSLHPGLKPSEVIHLNSEYFRKKMAPISFWLNFLHCKMGWSYFNTNFKSLD